VLHPFQDNFQTSLTPVLKSGQRVILLNIVIHVIGSRGDVQPFVALGKELQKLGHRVRIATHPTFKRFVEDNELEFFSIGGNPADLMAFMLKNPGMLPGRQAILEGEIGKKRKAMAEMFEGCWRSCVEAGNGMDADELESQPFIANAIIANPPSFAHIHCAEN
jgi:UDP:flavonoid glycosyltransferase YjiC (YdhE family)